MKSKLNGNLKDLFDQKAINVRGNMIEYIKHYKHNDTYCVCCFGINTYGVYFQGSIHEELNNQFFFQFDLNNSYSKIKDNPISVYYI